MKFGKLANIEGVNFDLPVDPPNNEVLLSPLVEQQKLNFYIGCTGWSMKEWVGKVYPPKSKTKDFLYHYSRQFNTIELNTTHYRIPTPSTIKNWFDQSAADFRFCPKVPQSISHHRQIGIGTGYIEAFCDSIIGLDEKLGVCFMQMPPYFDTKRISLLNHFLEKWPSNIPLAIEFRHESWFNQSQDAMHLFDQLANKNVGLVITDVAGRRDVLHMRITSPWVLLRFVGNGLVPSDYSRIDEWVLRWQQWFDQGLEELYCFGHEPDNILAPELVSYISKKAVNLQQLDSRGPKFYQDQTNSQISLF